MGSKTFLEKAIKNLKNNLKSDGFIFEKKLSDVNYSPNQPFLATSYCPELDTSVECSDKQVNLYHNIIGISNVVLTYGHTNMTTVM